MKDNNLNNSKNVEHIDIYYKPDGQITKSVYELLKNSKEGDYISLKKLVDEKEFQGSTLNLAFRNLIKDYKPDKPNYLQCLKLLLSTNIDLNYKFQKDNNSTILMVVFKKFEFYLMKDFLENLPIKINEININYLSNEKKEELEIKELKIFFSQKDSNNNNFMHLFDISFDKNELLHIFEYIYDIYPYYGNHKQEISKRIQQIFKNLFLEKNNEGNTIMNICLAHGLPKFVLKLLSINGYIPNTNNQKNNYIHCAILGKNMASLKILLYYCYFEELNMENFDGFTPAQLAFKLGFYTMSNIITEYQNNFNIDEYKAHFYSNMEIFEKKINNLQNDLLINFKKKKYNQVFYELSELKIINNIVCDNVISTNKFLEKEEELIYKISCLKLEWNILLTQIKIYQNNYEKNYENNNNNLNNKFGKNNKKKVKKIEEKNINSITQFFKSIYDIFENIFSNNYIISYIDLLNNYKINNKEKCSNDYINIEKRIDILIYNKIIFYCKIGNANSVIDTSQIYFLKIFPIYDGGDKILEKNSFILFVNISCILAELFISQGFHNFAEFIINALEKYLFKKYHLASKIDYNKEEITIFNYLNKIGVFNQFSAYFSEIFCYSNFLKLLITKDRIKELFEKNHKHLCDSKFSKDIIIFIRLYILNSCIEIKKLYEKEDNQIHNKISELHNIGEESEIYYYNTLGIIFLKKKKYYLSKMFFTKAFDKYIQIIKNKNIQNNDEERFLNFRIDYFTSLLYNISLCHFYLKNYNRCIVILEQLLLFKNNQKNYFINYRLALCYFYLYIEENKKYSDNYNENIFKLIGYEKRKNKLKKNQNDKALSIDLENEVNNENLLNKHDSEYKVNINKINYNNINTNDNINIYNYNKYLKKNIINEEFNNYSDNNYFENKSNTKRIILKNVTKLMNNNNNTRKFLNKNIELYKNKNTSNYIEKAIKHFKKVILIYKNNTYNESMKSLFNFYSFYIDEKIEKSSEHFFRKKKIPNELLINTYLNLLLCLSIKKHWSEMIFLIKDYNNKKIITNKIVILKILLYKLEAYINLKNKQKIKEIINKLSKYKKIEISVFNKANNDIINEVNIKLYLHYTLTIIYIKEKNYYEIERNIKNIINLFKDENNIPYYIIDLLINAYCFKLNNEPNLDEKTKYKYNNMSLNFIKNKRIIFNE